ncbi:protein kinase domain-containing protein [Evansella cellulosilytica]|uniref:Protein kinase domain-containing protein n=1 Tax=Evansella cellulosilytica (strain ATCC 21833 / DSM 2522 / FERM P-1141 / JCM 9156 / N-4) TaxID=649639 RepID=E6U1R4_EVAC2|nr:hypothetical protein Bcell_3319 [Evansella cellulosilytica DSM 2522]
MIRTVKVDDVIFSLKEVESFDWLKGVGKVFRVFSEQDSGNLCFGVMDGGVKKFVKYAGAKTVNYEGKREDAIARLKKCIPIYEQLKHDSLVNLIDHFEVENGYALVFDWFEGESLHSPGDFPPPHKYKHPDSPYYRFKQMPVKLRLKSLNTIFQFHIHVEKNKYVAIDFYDGSILYDFKNNQTKICDIDFYEKKPYVNEMGRLWGSKRFMSPEEFQLGAAIDEKTNVFNMGAVAFALLGGELDRSYSKWEGSKALYAIAKKAVEQEKHNRYTSVEAFYNAWISECGLD